MSSVKGSLIYIFKAIFLSIQHLNDEELEQLTSGDIEEWDSLNQLNLLAAIEEEFELQIPDDEALKFNSFLYIEEYLNNVKA